MSAVMFFSPGIMFVPHYEVKSNADLIIFENRNPNENISGYSSEFITIVIIVNFISIFGVMVRKILRWPSRPYIPPLAL